MLFFEQALMNQQIPEREVMLKILSALYDLAFAFRLV
jgi:hypothetical protein